MSQLELLKNEIEKERKKLDSLLAGDNRKISKMIRAAATAHM